MAPATPRHLVLAVILLGVGMLLMPALAEAYRPLHHEPRFRPTQRYCSDYAREYVRRYGERGGVVGGAVDGAVRGAVLGGIVDGKDGARRGARIGGAVGGLRGGRVQRRDNDWLYRRAYDNCLRAEWAW